MTGVRILLARLRGLFVKRDRQRDLDEELQFHLDMQAADHVRAGMATDTARMAARRSFGGVTQTKELYRSQLSLPALEQLVQDVRYAMRSLRKNAGYTIVAALTLAIGIGATTSIFSVIEAVLLRPLPYRQADRLAVVPAISYENYEEWKARTHAFEEMAVTYRNSGWSRVTLLFDGEPQTAQGGFVSANFFPLMGVSPRLGRVFTADDEKRRARVVVLSHALWVQRFGSSPDVLGQTLRIDGIDSLVIGVMPEEFQFPDKNSQFWAPVTTNRYWPEKLVRDTAHNEGYYRRWQIIGRLRAGTGLPQAEAEFDPRLRDRIAPLSLDLSNSLRRALVMLFGAVCFVLLIACTNVANLVLARGASREREVSVRAALGAGRLRIAAQMFIESALLALLGGALGLAGAAYGIRALVAFGPPGIPRLEQTRLDPGVVLFALASSLAAALICGFAPAWKLSACQPVEGLKAGGRTASGTAGLRRTRALLAMLEIALSVILLTGAGLLVRSFVAIEAVDPGFKPQHVLTLRVAFPSGTSDASKAAFATEALLRMKSLPGVQSVGMSEGLFELGGIQNLGLRGIQGRVLDERHDAWTPLTWRSVGGDYFATLGLPLLRGRFFTDRDGSNAPLVAIIDESMARRYWQWPAENPVGQRIKGQDKRGRNDDWVTIIGVVADARNHGLEALPTPHVFESHKQSNQAVAELFVRTSGDPGPAARSLRQAVRSLDPTVILSSVTTLEQQLSDQLAPRRFQTWLLGLFSLIALVLASVGIYGVMHYSVTQRTHEMGIRMALGAGRSGVLRMVVREGLALTLAGLTAGLAGAFGLTQLLAKLLYGISPDDPITFASVAILLTGVALTACLMPALRASRVDPVIALRYEQ